MTGMQLSAFVFLNGSVHSGKTHFFSDIGQAHGDTPAGWFCSSTRRRRSPRRRPRCIMEI